MNEAGDNVHGDDCEAEWCALKAQDTQIQSSSGQNLKRIAWNWNTEANKSTHCIQQTPSHYVMSIKQEPVIEWPLLRLTMPSVDRVVVQFEWEEVGVVT